MKTKHEIECNEALKMTFYLNHLFPKKEG